MYPRNRHPKPTLLPPTIVMYIVKQSVNRFSEDLSLSVPAVLRNAIEIEQK